MMMGPVLCASSFATEMQKTQILMCDDIKESFWKDDEQEICEWDDKKKKFIMQHYKEPGPLEASLFS